MNAQTKKALAKTYGAHSPSELEDAKKRTEAFLANPGEAKPDEIQSAKDTIEYIEDVLTAPESESPREESAADKLAQLAQDEKDIKAMVAGGLERGQAEAALKHKKEFAVRHARHVADQKKNAAKK